MSENKSEELEGADEVCASCGIAAIDDITLKFCDDCDLVKYCSGNCRENHREQHEEECKKRKAELHDKQLFTQPDISHLGECTLCCLPLPIDERKSSMMPCCCKIICNGCNYANQKREREAGLKHRCAFCREPLPKSEEESDRNFMKRIKKHNDPVAITHMGKHHASKGEYKKTVEYYTKAAKLGDVGAYFHLGCLYHNGKGVEKDQKKAMYHLEQAAIGGHPQARIVLAGYEQKNGRSERAVKHLMIAADLGCDTSLQCIKELFVYGKVSKEEYASALRGYQTAVNEMKSAERDEAKAFHARQLNNKIDN